MSFQRQLHVGRVGESLIAEFFKAQGHSVQPVYDLEKSTGKGPQLFSATGELVLPDMLVMGGAPRQLCYAEAKHKSVFTWHRNSQQWTTGIDERHYQDYLQVEAVTNIPVWLFFFHRESQPSPADLRFDCPAQCPTGLYGGKLSALDQTINHRTLPYDAQRECVAGHGRSGMVYWAERTLTKYATADEVLSIQSQQRLERPA